MGTVLQFMVFSKLDNLRYSFTDSVLFSETLSVNVALIAVFLSSHFADLIAIGLRNEQLNYGNKTAVVKTVMTF
jgi:hypothetical protein